MERRFDYDILPEIRERWSARAIDPQPVDHSDIMALLEAARYAPSCFNEQPWRFLIAEDEATLTKMRGVLTPSNQRWANAAPVLILIASSKILAANGKENYWHMFDAGTAWGYLSLEARRRGLIAHSMGGFNRDEARQVFAIPDDLDIMAVVAVGRYGNPEILPEDLQKREHPNTRKELTELLL